MAKSMFTIGANWSPKRQSIIEISVHLWSIPKALASVDDLFLRPVLSKKNYEDVCLEISQVSKETAVKQISSAILEFSKSDILQYEKEKNPVASDLGGTSGQSYPDVTGTLKIVSENPYCSSCRGVIQQFNQMFPNVKLILVDGVK